MMIRQSNLTHGVVYLKLGIFIKAHNLMFNHNLQRKKCKEKGQHIYYWYVFITYYFPKHLKVMEKKLVKDI